MKLLENLLATVESQFEIIWKWVSTVESLKLFENLLSTVESHFEIIWKMTIYCRKSF